MPSTLAWKIARTLLHPASFRPAVLKCFAVCMLGVRCSGSRTSSCLSDRLSIRPQCLILNWLKNPIGRSSCPHTTLFTFLSLQSWTGPSRRCS